MTLKNATELVSYDMITFTPMILGHKQKRRACCLVVCGVPALEQLIDGTLRYPLKKEAGRKAAVSDY